AKTATGQVAAAAIAASLGVSEDGTHLSSATVTISYVLDAGNEFLDATGNGTITVTNNHTSSITLSGSDTIANYLAVLQAVQYSNTKDDCTTTARTVNFSVNDGAQNSPADAVTVTISNSAPVVGGGGAALSKTAAGQVAAAAIAASLT